MRTVYKFIIPAILVLGIIYFSRSYLLGSGDKASSQFRKPTKSSLKQHNGKVLLHVEKNSCNFLGTEIKEGTQLYPPSDREKEAVAHILEFTGIPMGFEIYAADINNAMATVVEDQRLLVFDRKLLRENSKFSYWYSISILAHEIGHHLCGHTLSESGHKITEEMDADKFSGFILYKMGAPLEEALRAVKASRDIPANKTHPRRKQRIFAIESGWLSANQLRFQDATPPPPMDLSPSEEQLYQTTFEPSTFDRGKTFGDIQKGDGYGYYLSPMLEGVVVKGDYDKEFWFTTVLVTNAYGKKTKSADLDIGQQLVIEVIEDYEQPFTRRELNSLKKIMVAGRKIRFSYIKAGSGGFMNFAYLKYLPVIKTDQSKK